MMNRCRTYAQMLLRTFDAPLDAAQAQRLQAHLAHCDTCRTLQMELQQTRTALQNLPQPQCPTTLAVHLRDALHNAPTTKRAAHRALRIAATAMAIALVAFVGVKALQSGLFSPNRTKGMQMVALTANDFAASDVAMEQDMRLECANLDGLPQADAQGQGLQVRGIRAADDPSPQNADGVENETCALPSTAAVTNEVAPRKIPAPLWLGGGAVAVLCAVLIGYGLRKKRKH